MEEGLIRNTPDLKEACDALVAGGVLAANDVVLLVLWILASVGERAYVPMVVCFFMFLCNDLYSFFIWLRLRSAQKADISAAGDA